MKKILTGILIITLIATSSAFALASNGEKTAMPSLTKFVMDGKEVSLDSAYLIDGSNYLQLRSIAKLLNGTKSQFNVYWDNALRQAVIETGKPYIETAPAKVESVSSKVKTAKELEIYLQANLGVLKTNIKDYDFRNSIKVFENEDQFSCYDVAIIIPWSPFESEYYGIRNSIKYTEEQKNKYEDSIETYLKSMADIAIEAMPTRKIRGGFLQNGYKYPNLKMDYYEGTIFGWKNYEYSVKIMPYYEDTYVTKFHWHSFSGADVPMDTINLIFNMQ